MKNIILLIGLLMTMDCFSQGDTIVTNLNVRASVVETFIKTIKNSNEIIYINAFVKYVEEYRDGSAPSGNQNVNIDTIHTEVLVTIYRELRFNPLTQTAFTNFATDILSKRATNALLDFGCDAIDESFTSDAGLIQTSGRNILLGIK